MKTQSLLLWVLLTGALALGLGQGCAQTEALVEPTGLEALPSVQAEAPPVERVASEPVIQAEAPKPALEPAPEIKVADMVSPPSAPVEVAVPLQSLSPAKTITAIDVQRQDDGLVIVITGDGELIYQVIRLDGNAMRFRSATPWFVRSELACTNYRFRSCESWWILNERFRMRLSRAGPSCE